jgi:hypothetical protein
VLCGTYEESRDAYRFLVAKLEGKRQLGRTRHKWEHHVKMDLQEVSREHAVD